MGILQSVSASVSGGGDAGTDWLHVRPGIFTISITGTFSATVTLQRAVQGQTALDVETFAAPEQLNGEAAQDMRVRLFVKSGDYTSGTVTLYLGQAS